MFSLFLKKIEWFYFIRRELAISIWKVKTTDYDRSTKLTLMKLKPILIVVSVAITCLRINSPFL